MKHLDMRTLTPRETCIARAICQGLANKEIARELGIAVQTVKNHVSVIMVKLGVNSRTQIALLWHAYEAHLSYGSAVRMTASTTLS